MRSPFPSKRKQKGAVAIVFGLALTTVFGFMGLSLDLAQTYDRKTELQNAADAAALAGAKELVGTAAGIDLAVTKAQNIAAKHKFKYQTQVALANDAIRFSSSPDTADSDWLNIASAKATPSTLFFVKIDTRGGNANYGQVNTNFMQVSAATISTTNTFGRAVAGRFSLGVTPMGVCALRPNQREALPHTGLADAELMEFGYRRGIAYNIIEVNPLGATADKYLLNPVDIATSASDNGCTPSNNNTPEMRPFLCSGTSNIITSLPGYVFANTGMQSTLNTDFNTRFQTAASCTVPPDANIREYPAKSAATGNPTEWMTSPLDEAIDQTVKLNAGVPFYITATPAPLTAASTPDATNADDWGVLWSYSRAVKFASPNAPYATTDWPKLYPTSPVSTPPTPSTKTAYPASPPSPYSQTSGNFYSSGSGARDRRVLNVALIDCNSYKSNGKCSTLKVLGVGRFFMPVKADVPTSLNAEFAGLISEAELTAEIKLYH